MCVLIDAVGKSGLKRRSEVTRFFNYFPTNVEPYFECEDLGAKPLSRIIGFWVSPLMTFCGSLPSPNQPELAGKEAELMHLPKRDYFSDVTNDKQSRALPAAQTVIDN